MRKKGINIKNNLIKKLCLAGVVIYTAIILINQEKVLLSYKNQQKFYSDKIVEATADKELLLAKKESFDSDEYIESIAREKLNMYFSNERVYKNINK